MAKFNRDSPACLSDGTQVVANVPRFEKGKGIFIEEAVTNLVPISKQDFKTGWISLSGEGITVSDYDVYIPELGKTVTAKRITGDGKGTGTYKYYTGTVGYVSGDVITTSIYMQVLNGNTVTISSNLNAGTLAVSDSLMKKRVFTRTGTTTATAQIGLIISPATNVLDIVVYQPQQEKKAYATSYIPETRAAEQLTIPANTINVQGWTIEFDLYLLANGKDNRCGFSFGGATSTTRFELWYFNNGNNTNYRPAWLSGDSWQSNASKYIPLATITRITITGDTNGTNVYVNGQPSLITSFVLTNDILGNLLYLGCYVIAGVESNAYYSNLRISSRKHTDANILTDSALYNLPIEVDTTYKMDLQNNIGAAANPSVVLTGLGSNIVSRNGAGIRNAEIIGISGVRVDNTRKAFIDVKMGSQTSVIIKRNGSGQRKAVICGISAIKIIEPLITADLGITERQGETEVEGVLIAGNTIKLTAKFHTFSGALADPQNITLTFFDSTNKQIGSTIDITSANRVSAGIYEYFYLIPDNYWHIWYKFAGMQEGTKQTIPGLIKIERLQNCC